MKRSHFAAGFTVLMLVLLGLLTAVMASEVHAADCHLETPVSGSFLTAKLVDCGFNNDTMSVTIVVTKADGSTETNTKKGTFNGWNWMSSYGDHGFWTVTVVAPNLTGPSTVVVPYDTRKGVQPTLAPPPVVSNTVVTATLQSNSNVVPNGQGGGGQQSQATAIPVVTDCSKALSPRLIMGQKGQSTKSGAPLNMRDGAGKDKNVVGNIPNLGVFDVVFGPTCASNMFWWQVKSATGILAWIAEGDTNYFVEPIASQMVTMTATLPASPTPESVQATAVQPTATLYTVNDVSTAVAATFAAMTASPVPTATPVPLVKVEILANTQVYSDTTSFVAVAWVLKSGVFEYVSEADMWYQIRNPGTSEIFWIPKVFAKKL